MLCKLNHINFFVLLLQERERGIITLSRRPSVYQRISKSCEVLFPTVQQVRTFSIFSIVFYSLNAERSAGKLNPVFEITDLNWVRHCHS